MAQEHCGLLSLPLEILSQIVDYIVEPELWKDGTPNWDYQIDRRKRKDNKYFLYQQTICNLRLVNKRLCTAASHALLPILRIHMNEKSLTRARGIINNREVASGIEGVQLVVAYCPDNLVNNLSLFAAFKMEIFDRIDGKCDRHLQNLESTLEENMSQYSDAISGEDDDDDDVPRKSLTEEEQRDGNEGEIQRYRSILERWQTIREAWDTELQSESESDSDSSQNDERLLLHKGFRHFQAIHEEQSTLLATGQFGTQVASILSKLPVLQSLSITDQVSDRLDREERLADASTLTNDDKIIQILSEPMTWSSATDTLSDEDIDTADTIFANVARAASLLWDLPIALGRASVALRGLHIQCFPACREYELGTATGGVLHGTSDEFQSSLARLESFALSPDEAGIEMLLQKPRPLSNRQEAQIAQYIQQCTGGRHLRTLELRLDFFRHPHEFPFKCHDIYLDLGNALDHVQTKRLDKVLIRHASISHNGMKRLCERLGPQTYHLDLNCIYLRQGSWADVLDVLRSNIGLRVSQHLASIYLSTLENEEMYEYYRIRHHGSNVDRYYMDMVTADEDLIDSMREYIMRQLETNPFSKYHNST